MAEQKFGAVSAITAFVITLVPLIVGFSLTGRSIAVPVVGDTVNSVLGWLLVIAGLISVYAYFTKK